ncbi:uncharacterized protein LOC141667756 [Apium graveolens]|uniref:uncharacterized protein LOC141667756 n=1 Tax=Apium graveolens TaxID=4045 RepID=UPI003D7B2D7A
MKKPEFDKPTSTKIKFDSDSDEDDEKSQSLSSSEDEDDIKRELADVTFEDLQKARCDGSHTVYQKPNSQKSTSRANKNRPMEVTSKKPVGRFREVIQVPKKVARDPRFETLCGELDVDGFKKRYNFLYERELPAEKEELKKLMKKTKDSNAIDELKNRMTWVDKQLKSASTKHTDKKILSEHKKKEREAAKHGKKPFYLKKSQIREQKLIEQFKELKQSGKADSFIEKRRKKNAAKDHRFMPYRRSNDKEQQT